jgi:cytochrome P450
MRTGLSDVEAAFRSGSFFQEPHQVYRRLRDEAPVYWSPYLGQWLVTSYEHVEEVLRRPRVYSNFGFDTAYIGRLTDDQRADVPTLEHHFRQRGLIQADPPEHTRLRRALGSHFTGKAMAQLEDRIRAAIDELLAARTGDGLDVVTDLAEPLPVRVIAELLGVGPDQRAGFPQWSAAAVRFFGTPLPDAENARRLDSDLVEWRTLLETLLDERRRAPSDDLLTVVVGLIDSGSITEEEALFTCVHLLIAGHETTTNLIGNTMLCLLTHPAAMKAVTEDQTLIPGAIEEVLRFEPPIQRIRRVATDTASLGGAHIRPGEAVIPVLAAANRDPARFDEPEHFDIHRVLDGSAQRHVSFGHGVHFCLGAPLARLEAPAAIAAMLKRSPHAALPEGFVPDWKRTINMRGLRSLPITSRRVPAGSV